MLKQNYNADAAGSLEYNPKCPQRSSERLVRHARARIPNDVRAREGDYFVGSRAPQTQGQKGAQGEQERNKLNIPIEPAGTDP